MTQATARAFANIAFIKYWGNRDPALRLPLNDSLSMNLSGAVTTTSVRFSADLKEDCVTIDGAPADPAALARVVEHLSLVRRLSGHHNRAEVASTNSFPMGTGVASSASGFAALSLAASRAAGLDLDEAGLSRLARRASGSAARSIPGGFVEWLADDRDDLSFARSIAPAEHWALRDLVAVVSHTPKTVGSTGGHAAAAFSPLLPARLADLDDRLPRVRRALLTRDWDAFGPLVEQEALSLHAVAMTGSPSLLYFEPATITVLHAVRSWRNEGLSAFFTLDAGPNVHVLCERESADEIGRLLQQIPGVERVLVNDPAGPATIL